MRRGARVSEARVGSDIGGTFTDFVCLDARGATHVVKRLTTPAAPHEAVIDGLRMLRETTGPLTGYQMVHATTLVTNAVIEHKGVRTGLITTRGFRDVLELRRHMRTHVFDILSDPAPPLVPRWRRMEVDERVFSDGAVIVPLSEPQVLAALRELIAQGVRSIAVVYLHSYANPAHELRTRELIRSVAPDMDVSLSCEVLPLIGEFPRTTTTVINAYTQPLVRGYLVELAAGIRPSGIDELHIMTSDGGLTATSTAVDFPARIIESGPVAGVIAARNVAAACGLENVISFDMGGTTAKVCLVKGGEVPLTTDHEVARSHRFRKGSGYPVATPSVDLIEIGAGGGSIAQVNALGLIQVGPESAAASPGPACYSLGGTRPTVTDADLVLGYLSPTNFLGGRMRLDLGAARSAIERDIATPLAITIEEAAWRIHDVANEAMAAAVRRQIVEKGAAEEVGVLVAFGGAGPVHAFSMARTLGLETLIIPPRAGVASALGLVQAPAAYHVTHAFKRSVASVDGALLAKAYRGLEEEAGARVHAVMPGAPLRLTRWADMRYHGQGFEIRVDLDRLVLAELDSAALRKHFFATYEARFGYFYDDMEPEIINLHLTALAPDPSGTWSPVATTGGEHRRGERPAFDASTASFIAHAVIDRYALAEGVSVAGPAVIEENESTTVVGAGATATVHRSGALIVKVRA